MLELSYVFGMDRRRDEMTDLLKNIEAALSECHDFDAETALLRERDALIKEAQEAGYVLMFDGTFAKTSTFNID